MVFNGFTQIQVQWLAMVLVMKGPEKKRKCNISHFTTNLRNLQNTLHAPFHPFHFSSIVLICVHTESEIHDLKEDIAFMGPY